MKPTKNKQKKTSKPGRFMTWWNAHVLPRFQSKADKEALLESIAMLVASGMDVSTALGSAAEDAKTKGMKILITGIKERVDVGLRISQAFEQAGLFPRHVVSLMDVGEQAGQLPENLRAIVDQQRKDRSFKARIQSAMMYPILVLSVTTVIGVGVAWFILPQLAGVFTSLDLDLPLVTRVLIRIGEFLQDHGVVAVPIFGVFVVLLFYVVFFFPKTRFIGEEMLLVMPGVKKLIREVELSRFGFVMGNLMSAGLPIDEAIAALSKAASFRKYRRYYASLGIAIQNGQTFESFFDASKKFKRLLPSTVRQMVEASERSGTLPETLQRVGATFEQKIENTTKNLSTVLEPILLVIIWLGVVAVALAVVLPIYQLIGNLTDVASSGNPATTQVEEVTAEPEPEVDTVVPTEGPVLPVIETVDSVESLL